MVAVNDILGRNTLFFGLDRDGHTMLVGASDHHHILAAQAQKAGIDVGGHIYSGQMADVYRAVCIGEGGRNERTFEVLRHISLQIINQVRAPKAQGCAFFGI